MQLSNYPPGDTGTEPQIAGGADPIEEVRDGMYCAACETSWAISVVIEVAEFTQTVWWECPKCGAEHTFEEDLPDSPLPDEPDLPEVGHDFSEASRELAAAQAICAKAIRDGRAAIRAARRTRV